MANSHKISGSALIALKEALTNIYWIKNDLKMFVNHTINNKSFVSTLDMTKYKREIANDIVNRMSNRLDIYEEDLLLLLKAVSDMSDFSHLKKWEDADKKIKKAQESVEALRLHTKGYFAIIEEQKEAETRKITYQNKIQKAQFFQSELEKLKIDFNRMSASSASPQKRGYEFEQFLNSLFNLFDLDPKCSYKISGEQIDGAFTHDNQDYLIEAKWEAKAMPKSALHAFSGKVKDKLTTTLGLFISISGFADECIRRENSNIILMDYQDIIMVIENRIDLKQLIYLKRKHASQTGIILYHPAC